MSEQTACMNSQYMPDDGYCKQLADVILVVEGQRLPAHKLVLALHSEVFRQCFAHCSGTEQTAEPLVMKACFDNMHVGDVLLLLRYMYSLTPHEFLHQRSIQESAVLARLADQYQMPHLAQGCAVVLDSKFEMLAKTPEPDSKLLDWLLFADRYSISSLLVWCQHLVIKHFPTLSQDRRLKELSGECWMVIATGISYVGLMGEARAQCTSMRPCSRHIVWGCPEYRCVMERAGTVLSDAPSRELLLSWSKSGCVMRAHEQAGGADVETPTCK